MVAAVVHAVNLECGSALGHAAGEGSCWEEGLSCRVLGLAALLVWCLVHMQVQLLQQERSSEATAANPDQEAALEAAIRAETDFLMQVSGCMWLGPLLTACLLMLDTILQARHLVDTRQQAYPWWCAETSPPLAGLVMAGICLIWL